MIEISPRILLCSLMILVWYACQSDSTDISKKVIIENVHVLSMQDSMVQKRQDVIIDNDRVIAIEDHGKHFKSQSWQIIDGKGQYLMPALADAHIHLPLSTDLALKQTLQLLLCHGITWTRNTSGEKWQIEYIDANQMDLPKVYQASKKIRGDLFRNDDELKDSLNSSYGPGVDFLKIHRNVTDSQFDIISNFASLKDVRLGGHVPLRDGLIRALHPGRYEALDHLDGFFQYLSDQRNSVTSESLGFYGEDLVDELDFDKQTGLAEKIKQAGVAIVPTLHFIKCWYDFDHTELGHYKHTKYIRPGYLTRWNNLLTFVRRRINFDEGHGLKILAMRDSIVSHLHSEGVIILAGSGSYEVNVIPGFSLTDELESLHRAGLTRFAALQTATSNVSQFYQLDRGIIGLGMKAELLLLEENPLDSFETLRDPKGLFYNGRWFDYQSLRLMREQLVVD